ncbi:MAG: biotin/lipoyl-binding protein [Burkholderiaceae bacterium]
MSQHRQRAPALRSRHWYRVRALRPVWRDGLQVSRQSQRDGQTQVIGFEDLNRRLRLNESAWSVVGRCDGKTSLDEIWRTLSARDPALLPPQDDLIHLIGKLVGDGFLICGDWPDLRAVAQADDDSRRRDRSQRFNPLAPRISLGSPAALLERLSGLGEMLFSRAGALAFALLMMIALLTLAGERQALTLAITQSAGSPGFWWLTIACYVGVKAIHELAHGLAVRRFGAQVHEAGIALLMGMPAPYVDASAADGFASRGERALVSAAGILAELGLAALALLAWSALAPGLARELCLSVMLIGGVSTVMFNGNPLVRLDGYYLLTDLAALPALGERSRAHWLAFWRRHLLAVPTSSPEPGRGERAWLWLYAPAAWIYRATLMFWVSGWIGGYSRVAGLGIAIAALIWLLVMPIIHLIRAPASDGHPLHLRLRAWGRLGVAALAVLLVAMLPMPDRVWAPAMVWWPESGRVRIADEGFVRSVLVRDGQSVRAGDPLLLLEDPELDAEIKRWQAVLAGRADTWFAHLEQRGQEVAGARERIHQAERELAHLSARRQRLTVRAPGDGQVQLTAAPSDLLDRFLRTGSLVAVVGEATNTTIKALIDQPTLARLRLQESDATEVAVATDDGRLLRSRLQPGTPAAVRTLPDNGFARALGGDIDADRDPESAQWRPRRPAYPLTVSLGSPIAQPAGTRVKLRIDLGHRPLIAQWADRLWQTLDPRLAPDWS